MGWHPVAGADALGDEEALGLVIEGHDIAVCRVDGEFHAIHNICTHQHALLSDGYVEDGCIECPLHQGRFDLKTGAAQCAPVTEPVKVYRTKVENGQVFVEIE